MRPTATWSLRVAVVAGVVAGLLGCAAQSIHSEGMKLIAAGQRSEGLALLAQAVQEEPTNSRYRIDFLKQQSLAVRDLLTRADAAFAAGRMEDARVLYGETLTVQPGNDRARRGLAAVDLDARHRAVIAEATARAAAGDLAGARARLRQVLLENPSNASAQRAMADVVARIDRAEEAARQKIEAASVLNRPVTLQFRDTSLRMVFEALSRTTGLNVIFDRDVRADLKTTIFVRDASVGDSVNMILLQNQLEKKVLNANTLFVYPATSAKHKEYQDLKVRTFQISNADAKHLQTVLKTVLKVRDVALDERTNTLVIRDTADAVGIAEKVIAAHDVPDPEVMLEVEVLEVSRDRLSDIGILWPDNVTISTPPGVETLGQLRDMKSSDLLVTPLSVGVNLKLQDTDANLLASPRIRARNKEKARIMIGDKVPVITNSVTPIQTGSAVVTGTVQYLDVGIKLEVEPQIYAEGDVGIKLNLEVSNIVKEVRNLQSGTLAYQIGSRSAQTNLRLRDGETQILGGLISDLDRNTAAKVPGLGELPVLGRLFSSHATNATKSEIILSITPRIVRSAVVADAALRDVYAGTDATMRMVPLRLDPVGSVSAPMKTGAAPPAPRAAPPVLAAPPSDTDAPKPVEPAAAVPPEAPAAEQAPAAPTVEPTGSGAGGAASDRAAAQLAAAAPAPRPAPAMGGVPLELSLRGPANVRVGEEFEVDLEALLREPLQSFPLNVRFDPLALSFLGTEPAPLLARGDGGRSATPKVDPAKGTLDFDLRLAAEAMQGGRGKLLKLRFAARAARSYTPITIGPVTLQGEAGTRTLPRPPTLLLRVEQ
jgi:general secretion pathway protein D